MNMRTTLKVIRFLESKDAENVTDIQSVDLDLQSGTLDIAWMEGGKGFRYYELVSAEDITEFLEYLTSE